MSADNDNKARLLVVGEDPAWAPIVRTALDHGGFDSEAAPPDAELAPLLGTGRFDALIIARQGKDFPARLRSLRAAFDIPVAVLASDCSEAARIEALDSGADQLLARPITPGEVVARVRAMLRRAPPAGDSFGLVLDPATRRVRHLDEVARLTPAEYGILECLVQKRGAVAGREEIVEHLEGPDHATTATSLEAIISKLRRKLRRIGCPGAIVAVRGQGWIFRQGGSA